MATYMTDAEVEALIEDLKLSLSKEKADAIVAIIDAAVQAGIDAHLTAEHGT
jgi:hypothetical protein